MFLIVNYLVVKSESLIGDVKIGLSFECKYDYFTDDTGSCKIQPAINDRLWVKLIRDTVNLKVF
jgi:hypothetical protein